MPKQKPIPQQPKELSQSQITPYLGTKPSFSDEVNRGNELTRKDDNVSDVSIGLKDIDESIIFYFDNIIKPTVYQAGETIKVPIIYGAPERWKAVQADGFYRDKDGKVQLPLIMFKRSNFEKNRNLTNKLDGNEANLFQVVEKKYTKKNIYDAFSVLNNRVPEREFYVTMVPDYVTVIYDCIIFTNYVEQMNKMIEAINFASDSYWGDKSRFKFKARIDNFQTTTELSSGEDRAVKTTFSIILNGYIIPDSVNKFLATKVGKFYSKCQLIFTLETTEGLETFTTIPQSQNKLSTAGVDSFNNNTISITSGGGGVSQDILDYINTNKSIDATSLTTNTAIFPKGFLSAPSGFASTSVVDFKFFVNGQLINSAAITSFVNGGSISTLTVNTVILGFTFQPTDTITGIGKFSA